MPPNETHQVLDSEITSMLELYHCGYIGLDKLKKNLAKVFGDPQDANLRTDLFAYLNRVVDQNRLGEISADELRADLIRMAALAKTNDAVFVDNIWRRLDETP